MTRSGKQIANTYAWGQGDVVAVTIGERFYPLRLHDVPAPPPRLFVRGRTQALAGPRLIAVVGPRRASAAGMSVAQELSAQIASAGVGIVSGLAEGIDAVAHDAALVAGAETIAVLGSGLDQVSPSCNQSLAEQIVAAGGALISEQPPGTPALPRYLVARNRLVTGISAAVLIIECEPASGTLHTARFAAEQGRPIFVPPRDQQGKANEGIDLLRERFRARSFDRELLVEVCAAPVPVTNSASSQLRLDVE